MERTVVPRNKEQAESTLQTLIKILYSRLFNHIVSRINENSLNGQDLYGQHTRHIGVLDIYGFEELQVRQIMIIKKES